MTDHDPLGIAGELIAEKYQIEHLVGEGGFAVVYRAKHVIWDRPVAVKFFNGLSRVPSDYRETLQQQFVDEGALLTELSVQTPGIVQARAVGFYTTPDGQWVPYHWYWVTGVGAPTWMEMQDPYAKNAQIYLCASAAETPGEYGYGGAANRVASSYCYPGWIPYSYYNWYGTVMFAGFPVGKGYTAAAKEAAPEDKPAPAAGGTGAAADPPPASPQPEKGES